MGGGGDPKALIVCMKLIYCGYISAVSAEFPTITSQDVQLMGDTLYVKWAVNRLVTNT